MDNMDKMEELLTRIAEDIEYSTAVRIADTKAAVGVVILIALLMTIILGILIVIF